jgi:hypothetical protein
LGAGVNLEVMQIRIRTKKATPHKLHNATTRDRRRQRTRCRPLPRAAHDATSKASHFLCNPRGGTKTLFLPGTPGSVRAAVSKRKRTPAPGVLHNCLNQTPNGPRDSSKDEISRAETKASCTISRHRGSCDRFIQAPPESPSHRPPPRLPERLHHPRHKHSPRPRQPMFRN